MMALRRLVCAGGVAVTLCASVCAAAVGTGAMGSAQAVDVTDCEVVIGGGSLASVAAALAAANYSRSVGENAIVCYLEITDHPGGQMTAGGVPAIDFGATYNNFPVNLPGAFGNLLSSGKIGDGGKNPGGCTVSAKCFPQGWALEWLFDAIASLPNLRVYYNTTIISAARNMTDGMVFALYAVQRTPMPGTSGYDRLLSQALTDWYSPLPSPWFSKKVFNLTGFKVVIEATEFGDILMASGVLVAQGVETPIENATTYDDTCGQATAIGFYLSYGDSPSPQPDPAPPGGDEGDPFFLNATADWEHAVVWRRSLAVNASDVTTLRQGDLNLIQDSNDLTTQLLWLPLSVAYDQMKNGTWAGGVNLTVLAALENRAYGWYHYLLNTSTNLFPEATPYLRLNYSAAYTPTGLMKMPYLRESRRSRFGIQGFRLCHDFAAIADNGPGCWKPPADVEPGFSMHPNVASERGAPVKGDTGYHWVDVIGIGNYGFDVHRLSTSVCTLPQYLQYSPDPYPAVPYYLPFRALTSWFAPNLLVAGKSMAQTFYANAVTRLHPEEWVTGTAAGVAAGLMVERGWTQTETVYDNIAELQAALKSDAIRQPLEWT